MVGHFVQTIIKTGKEILLLQNCQLRNEFCSIGLDPGEEKAFPSVVRVVGKLSI